MCVYIYIHIYIYTLYHVQYAIRDIECITQYARLVPVFADTFEEPVPSSSWASAPVRALVRPQLLAQGGQSGDSNCCRRAADPSFPPSIHPYGVADSIHNKELNVEFDISPVIFILCSWLIHVMVNLINISYNMHNAS